MFIHSLHDLVAYFMTALHDFPAVDFVSVLGVVPALNQYGLQHFTCCPRLDAHDSLFDGLTVVYKLFLSVLVIFHSKDFEVKVI